MRLSLISVIVPAAIGALMCDPTRDHSPGVELTLTDAACATCSIGIDTISSPEISASDPVSFMVPPVVDSRGRAILVNRNHDALIVFDSAGRRLMRIGEPGSGEGEFEAIDSIRLLADDSIAVMDIERDALLVFTKDGKFVRETRFESLERGIPSLALRDGRFLMPQSGGDVVVIGTNGDRQSTFRVAGDKSASDRCRPCGTLVMAVAGEGRVWSSPINDFVLRMHDLSGAVDFTIRRRTSWFTRWTSDAKDDQGVVRPRVAGLYQAPDSILWAVLAIPNDSARTHVPGSLTAPAPGELLRRQMTRIEAIDLAEGKLIASQTFPGTLSMLPSGHVAILRIAAAGDAVWEIGRLRLAY